MAETYFIRYSKQRDYTVMNNTFLRDNKLSWKAKGLFAYILSLPEDWKIYLNELQTHATDGETSLRSAIKELTDNGYIIQKRLKDDKGRWASYAYQIIENPNVENPNVENPDMENPNVENPDMENQVLLNTNNTKYLNQLKTNKSSKDDTQSPLIPKLDKKTKKAKDIVTMRGMINAFTENEDIRDKLLEYFNIRVKKGLQPNQWQIILDDLRNFAGDSASIALDKINNAIAGGYMQIIAAWEKDKKNNFSKSRFDNTSGRKVEAVVNMTEEEKKEFEENLAKDENGNLLQF
jgi:hypothetical protein